MKKTKTPRGLFSLFEILFFAVIIIPVSLVTIHIYNSTTVKPQNNNQSPITTLTIKDQPSQKPPQPTIKVVSKNSAPLPIPIPSYQLRVPILMYHYVGNNPDPKDRQRDILSISPSAFREQMSYLKENGYNTISLDTLYAALQKKTTLPPKSVILTFDDGYIDFYYNAYPILQEFGLHATLFIPTGLMGQSYYLTWAQIKEMHSSNLITFGAHSVHHYNLPSLSPEALRNELTESKKVLQDTLGVPINFMAYPYGATSSQVINEAIKAGYIGAVGTWPGVNQSENVIYNMPRERVNGFVNLEKFAGYL